MHMEPLLQPSPSGELRISKEPPGLGQFSRTASWESLVEMPDVLC